MIIKTIIITRLIIVIIKNVGVEQDHGGSRWSAVMEPEIHILTTHECIRMERKREEDRGAWCIMSIPPVV